MAENNNDGGSATTILVTVVIVVIIGLAFYFGFMRGNSGDNTPNDVNVDLNIPNPGGGDEGGSY